MSDALERELRASLAEKAATMPADAAERLARVDYSRRRGRSFRPKGVWTFVSATGVGISGAAVAVVWMLSSAGTALVPLAYAGYSAIPGKPTPAELLPAIRECKPWLQPSGNNAGYPGHLVLTDKRGRYVVAIYAAGPDMEACIVSGSRFEGNFGGGAALRGQPAPGPGQLGLPAGGGGGAIGFPGSRRPPLGGVESHVVGLAGPGVSAVTFILAHNRTVNATVEHGWYFAWWPERVWSGLDLPVAAQVTTSSGVVTSSLPAWRHGSWHCSRHCVFRLSGPSWVTIHHIY